jgi:hypothetical protein
MFLLFTAYASYDDLYGQVLIGVIAKVEQWTAYIKLMNRAMGYRDCTIAIPWEIWHLYIAFIG